MNCATRLADLIHSYAGPHTEAPESIRGFDSANDLEAWRRHGEACRTLSTVDQTLQGMTAAGEDTTMFTQALPRWYAAVHFATTPFGSRTQNTSTRAACPAADVYLLRSLGLLLDAGGALHINEDDRRSLADVLDEAHSLIDGNPDGLPLDVYRYLHGLIARARMIVDNLDDFGPDAVRQVALELGGALTVQAEKADGDGDPARAGRFRSAAHQLMIGFLGGMGSGAAGRVVEAGAQVAGELTQGL